MILTCSNVSFSYGDEAVITDLSFEIYKHSHTVIKGESGSGKSTVLKLLLGFLTPDSGRIQFPDNETWPHSIRQQTAWLPQDLDLGEGTVTEVMRRPLRFKNNASTKVHTQKVEDTLDALGLAAGILDNPFRDLSTGQRQRVGIAICHLLDKPIVMLDEPTSALDQTSKQKVADLLISSKQTVISASHDPFWVHLANRLIELHEPGLPNN